MTGSQHIRLEMFRRVLRWCIRPPALLVNAPPAFVRQREALRTVVTLMTRASEDQRAAVAARHASATARATVLRTIVTGYVTPLVQSLRIAMASEPRLAGAWRLPAEPRTEQRVRATVRGLVRDVTPDLGVLEGYGITPGFLNRLTAQLDALEEAVLAGAQARVRLVAATATLQALTRRGGYIVGCLNAIVVGGCAGSPYGPPVRAQWARVRALGIGRDTGGEPCVGKVAVAA